MKISKTFRLSEEAVKQLEEQPNATQFLEDLILLNKSPERKLEVVSMQQLDTMLEEKLTILKKMAVAPQLNQIIEVPQVEGFGAGTVAVEPTLMACCLANAPCRHWSFDGAEGHWVNSITGQTRED